MIGAPRVWGDECREVPDSVPKQLQAGFGEFVEWLLPLNVDAAIGLGSQVPLRARLQTCLLVPDRAAAFVLCRTDLLHNMPARAACALALAPVHGPGQGGIHSAVIHHHVEGSVTAGSPSGGTKPRM